MARTRDPHAATLKAWLTRARANDAAGQGRDDYARELATAERHFNKMEASYKTRDYFHEQEMKRLGFGGNQAGADTKAFNAAYEAASKVAEQRLTDESREYVALQREVDAARERVRRADAVPAVEAALRAKTGPVTIDGDEADRQLIKKMLPDATEADFRALATAMPGSAVKVRVLREAGKPPAIEIKAEGGGLLSSERVVKTASDGALVLENVGVELDPALRGVGLGTLLFSQQASTASLLGCRAIVADCSRGRPFDPMNGYYSWAAVGFDGKGKLHTGWPPRGEGKTVRISEQMRTPEGRRAWRASGDSFKGTFSLRPGSYSMRTLREYLARQGVR